MKKRFANIVGAENVSDNSQDLEAYSYCSSDTELKPSMIIWPRTTEQVRRVLLFINQSRTPVAIRGSGTSLVDGCIVDNAIVLSSERMNKTLKLDLKNKLIELEAGVRIADLNKSLSSINMIFPILPFSPTQTIGGMLALNALSKESQILGKTNDWVEEVEFVDGTGKSFYTRKKELLVGKEGLSGFITRTKIRITELSTLSLDVFSFTQLSDLLGQVRFLSKNKEVYFLEFFDRKTAKELGFENNYLLIAAYTMLKGKVRTMQDVKNLLEKIESAHSIIRSQGYYYIEGPWVGLEKTYDLIEWCEKHEVRLRGHIGLGLFYAYFQKKDKDLLETFRSFIKRIGGNLGLIFGCGSQNKAFVPPEKKKELIKIKDEYDYNNLLNPGKIIDYR
jgi:FAD/FMN-containing dehydrogenase